VLPTLSVGSARFRRGGTQLSIEEVDCGLLLNVILGIEMGRESPVRIVESFASLLPGLAFEE
jgi:hypothetical protein